MGPMPRFYLELEDLEGGQSVLSRMSQDRVLVGGWVERAESQGEGVLGGGEMMLR